MCFTLNEVAYGRGSIQFFFMNISPFWDREKGILKKLPHIFFACNLIHTFHICIMLISSKFLVKLYFKIVKVLNPTPANEQRPCIFISDHGFIHNSPTTT